MLEIEDEEEGFYNALESGVPRATMHAMHFVDQCRLELQEAKQCV